MFQTHFLSTSLMKAEKTRAFISALPAARSTLFGCQSRERTVELLQYKYHLVRREKRNAPNGLFELFGNPPVVLFIERADCNGTIQESGVSLRFKNINGTYRAPLATANLSSFGLHRTKVAARLIRSKTNVGFQVIAPV